jgi:superfamily II DNA/RNA helicase
MKLIIEHSKFKHKNTYLKSKSSSEIHQIYKMSDSYQKPLTHHLTTDVYQKNNHLFEVLDILKMQQNASNVSKVVVLTRKSRTAEYLTLLLNIAGITASTIHIEKSKNENKQIEDDFNEQKFQVLVTTSIEVSTQDDCLEHIINYDLFKSDPVYYLKHPANNVFHVQKLDIVFPNF